MRPIGRAAPEGGRGDVDDATLALRAHERRHRAPHEPRATDVGAHDAVPLLDGELIEGGAGQVAIRGGVVDQDVDAPVGFVHLPDPGRHAVPVPDIQLHRHVAGAHGRRQRRHHRQQSLQTPSGRGDRRSLGGELLTEGLSQAARRPGDHADLPVQAATGSARRIEIAHLGAPSCSSQLETKPGRPVPQTPGRRARVRGRRVAGRPITCLIVPAPSTCAPPAPRNAAAHGRRR